MRLLGAIRLSRETDETTSPQRQRTDINTDAGATGDTVVAWAEDLDISADVFSPFDRPELGPWLKERTAEYDGVIFAKADRAIRSMRDMHQLSEWAIQNRKVIVFVTGPGGGPRMALDFRSGPLDTMAQFMVMVFAFVGEMELNVIKDRNRGSYALARTEGRWHGGVVPYGYRPLKRAKGEGWIIELDDYSQGIVMQILSKFLVEKWSLNSICHDLNDKGILTPQDYFRECQGRPTLGNKWRSSTLSRMLRSHSLLGYAEDKGKLIYDDDGMPMQRAEAVISRELWSKVQVRLQEVATTKPRTKKTGPLLQVAFCIFCGAAQYRSYAGRDSAYPYYRCRTANSRWEACKAKSIPGDALEALVESVILDHLGGQFVVEEIRIPAESHTAELQEATAALDDMIESSAGKPDAVKAIYKRKIELLEKRIAVLSELPERPARTEVRSTGRTFSETWIELDKDGRRTLMVNAGVRIESGIANGPAVQVHRFERPERYDEAVLLGNTGKIQYAVYLPKNLIALATRPLRQITVR